MECGHGGAAPRPPSGTHPSIETTTLSLSSWLSRALKYGGAVSGLEDTTLRLWDIDSGECLKTLTGHGESVHSVAYNTKYVVSGSNDGLVKVWDPLTGQCLRTLQGHTGPICSLQFNGTHIASASDQESLRVWDVETGDCLHTFGSVYIPHWISDMGCMQLRGNILAAITNDVTIEVWNIITSQCLCTIKGPNQHRKPVNCVRFHGRFLITGSDDGTVQLWDLTSGQLIRDLVTLDTIWVQWDIRCSANKLICDAFYINEDKIPTNSLLLLSFDPEEQKS